MTFESEVNNFTQRFNKRFGRFSNSSQNLFPRFEGQMAEREFNFAKGNGGSSQVLISNFEVLSFQDKFTKINEEIDNHEEYMVQERVQQKQFS